MPSSALKVYFAVPVPATLSPAPIPWILVEDRREGGLTKSSIHTVMVQLAPVSMMRTFSSSVRGVGKPEPCAASWESFARSAAASI